MHIIRYTGQIDFACAHNEVMDIFLFDKNGKIRQLALTTLHKINDRSDMDFLLKQMDFEKDPEVLKHLTAVLVDRERLHFIPRDSEQRMAILPSN